MGKLIRWLLILLVAGLVVSQITIHTSLYARKDNSVEIAFPQWKADDPWIYLYWTPGFFSIDPHWRKALQPDDPQHI